MRIISKRGAVIQVHPPWGADQSGVKYFRVVVHRSGGPAKADEIRALHKLSGEMERVPMGEAAKRIASARSIDLGTYPMKDALDLKQKAEEWGLNARLQVNKMHQIKAVGLEKNCTSTRALFM